MIEFEDENHEFLTNTFGPELECARSLLATGQNVENSLGHYFEEHSDDFDPRTATVVMFVFTQLLRRCRAGILVWEFGYTAESEILARSLFEAHLGARFIIEPQLPQPHWSSRLRDEFDVLCGLSGEGISRFTDMNFRAMLYAACRTLKLDKKTESFKAMANLQSALPNSFGDGMRLAAAEVESEIGEKWADRIRKKGSFHGLSQIKLLAEYCGVDKQHYYQTLYGLQSASIHGEDALSSMCNPTPGVLRRTLCVPCAIFGESIEDFNRVFSLGYATQLQEMTERIGSVFRTDETA